MGVYCETIADVRKGVVINFSLKFDVGIMIQLIISKSEYYILRRRLVNFQNEICYLTTMTASNNIVNGVKSLNKGNIIQAKVQKPGYSIFYYVNKNHVNPIILEFTYKTILNFNYGERMLPVIFIMMNVEQLQSYEEPTLIFAKSPQ